MLSDDITPEKVHDFITWVNTKVYEKPVKLLKIFLSSTGGDVDSSIRMYYFIKALPFAVETIGFSQIDSAANIIFLAGTKKKIAIDGCRFFLHDGNFTVTLQTGTLQEHAEKSALFENMFERNVTILSKETGNSLEAIKALLRNSTFLTTKEAKDLGFVDEVIEKLPIQKID